MPEIYLIVIFFIIKALINPTFEEFSYFFLLNVIGVTKFVFALLVLVGQICHLLGALVYRAWCRNVDTRTMILWAMITGVIGGLLSLVFAKRWNLDIGVGDMFFLIFTDVVFNVLGTILYSLPIMSLFAKITPKRVEGTIFAFLTGTMNFSNTVISPAVGTFINHEFIGVNKNDLSGYWVLVLIGLICSILSFPLLFLIPTK